MVIKATESVGLRGAKTIGDKRVSSLLQFSWGTRNDGKVNGHENGHTPAPGAESHGQSSLPKERPAKTD